MEGVLLSPKDANRVNDAVRWVERNKSNLTGHTKKNLVSVPNLRFGRVTEGCGNDHIFVGDLYNSAWEVQNESGDQGHEIEVTANVELIDLIEVGMDFCAIRKKDRWWLLGLYWADPFSSDYWSSEDWSSEHWSSTRPSSHESGAYPSSHEIPSSETPSSAELSSAETPSSGEIPSSAELSSDEIPSSAELSSGETPSSDELITSQESSAAPSSAEPSSAELSSDELSSNALSSGETPSSGELGTSQGISSAEIPSSEAPSSAEPSSAALSSDEPSSAALSSDEPSSAALSSDEPSSNTPISVEDICCLCSLDLYDTAGVGWGGPTGSYTEEMCPDDLESLCGISGPGTYVIQCSDAIRTISIGEGESCASCCNAYFTDAVCTSIESL